MQATLTAHALKPFTRALTCLAKYGDDMILTAASDGITLSCTNSSQTAYCSFNYHRDFFQSYNVGPPSQSRYGHGETSRASRTDQDETPEEVIDQVQTKSLLSVLKHRNLDRMAERCELLIIEGEPHAKEPAEVQGENDNELEDEEHDEHREQTGGDGEEDGDRDSVESRLIVRLFCKHGVVKTHRLLLYPPLNNLRPVINHPSMESHICVSPQTVKEILDHFPSSKGPRSDPQLVWRFNAYDVKVKTIANSLDSKGRQALATELSMVQDDFEVYDIRPAPTTIAFHLREFNAAVAFAESSSLPLDLHFTQPAEPLFITAEPDGCDVLFVISTFQVRGDVETEMGGPSRNPEATVNSARNKRPRTDEGSSNTSVIRKSVKVVERTDRSYASEARDSHITEARLSSVFTQRAVFNGDGTEGDAQEPLFLPQSQLSLADNGETLQDSGLGIEHMDEDELAAMLEDDGEEVNAGIGSQMPQSHMVIQDRLPDEEINEDRRNDYLNGVEQEALQPEVDMAIQSLEDSLDIVDDGMEFGPTQLPARQDSGKTFRPLFDD